MARATASTHLAARMKQLAAPGTIQLTAETLRLVEGLVEVTSVGPVPVKGLGAPIEVFERQITSLLGVHPFAPPAGLAGSRERLGLLWEGLELLASDRPPQGLLLDSGS